ncbi:MAG: hypothetical protein ACQEW9_04870 [Bacteroidota bacterium]
MKNLSEVHCKLLEVKAKLKIEFIGLDHVIDQLIDAVTPWCTFNDIQNRPLVINLWGMTGVGKTSLVKRFLQLWNPNESVLQFNLGSKTFFRDLLGSMENMQALTGVPSVIIFDEFQHAKTVEGSGKELENPLDRMIWQLLDDGKYFYTKSWLEINEVQELIVGLELCLERGVKVEKGKIIEGWDYYKDIMSIDEDRTGRIRDMKDRNFLCDRSVSILFGLIKPEFKYKSMLRDYIFHLNGEEILELVKKIERKACVAKEIDFSKSLIFVIGNLDEAYEMSSEVSADHDPDFFYEESKKITFSKIKEGLKTRFRMEEIARLGNIHVIYPALSRQVFKVFINKELKEISDRYGDVVGAQIFFSESVKEMLFEEGVTASQGFRPLRSTIRYLIESTLCHLFQEVPNDPQNNILLDLKEDQLLLVLNGKIDKRKDLHLPVREAKRKKLKPQTLAITAVHEAGHALVYAVVFRKLPKMITLTSSDYFSGGFVEGESMLDFDNYDLIFRDVTVKMGGKKAEELVFGSDHQVTFGCSSDMKSATRILLNVARSAVLTGKSTVYENKYHGSGRYLPETEDEMEWVNVQLEKCNTLASQILNENTDILRIMIRILLQKNSVKAGELSDSLYREGVNLQKLFTSYPPLFDYQEKLEDFISESYDFSKNLN